MLLFLSKYIAYIRVFARIALIVLICFKTIGIAFSVTQAIKKEAFGVVAENDNDDAQKKAEKTDPEKEKEFTLTNSENLQHYTIYDEAGNHNTAYFINYKYSYFVNITIPPPDISSTPTA